MARRWRFFGPTAAVAVAVLLVLVVGGGFGATGTKSIHSVTGTVEVYQADRFDPAGSGVHLGVSRKYLVRDAETGRGLEVVVADESVAADDEGPLLAPANLHAKLTAAARTGAAVTVRRRSLPRSDRSVGGNAWVVDRVSSAASVLSGWCGDGVMIPLSFFLFTLPRSD